MVQREECLSCLSCQKMNCAETVLKMLGKKYNLNLTQDEMKLISGFGGGICGDICGALCGALAALGKYHVFECAHKTDQFVDTCHDFVNYFQKEMGGLTCTELYQKYATEQEGCLETVTRTLDVYDRYRKKEERDRMKVVIVGGVAGGASTAARLRRNNEMAEIILLEKGEFISFANCGLPYYIGNVITDKEALQLQTPGSFQKRFHVDVRVHSEVISVNTKMKWVMVRDTVSGDIYQERYDKLVLSPGSAPINPFGTESRNKVFTLRNIPDTYRIYDYIEKEHPKSCAVIGGGFIGLEVAENLVKRGIQVFVIEAADHLIAPIDADVACEVHNYMRKQGISLYLGKKCTEIEEGYIKLDNGKTIDTDFVIVSIGVRPETSFLKESGIVLGQKGEILVSDHMQTSIPDVYAIGDAVSVTNFVTKEPCMIPLAGPANKQGRIVADVISGKNVSYEGSIGTSIMKLFEMTVAVTGLKEETLISRGIDYKKSFTYSASHATYYPGGSTMLIKLIFTPNTGKILGAQIVGYEGVDKRIDSFANAIRFGMTVFDLQKMELAYAPPFSSAKDPVNMSGYVAENILDKSMVPYYVEDLDLIPKDALKIDVRTKEEYQRGSLPGYINIPLDELRDRINEIDIKKEIYVTCQIGLRGYLAQRILMGRGYTVYNLAGGYRRYQEVFLDQLQSKQC